MFETLTMFKGQKAVLELVKTKYNLWRSFRQRGKKKKSKSTPPSIVICEVI